MLRVPTTADQGEAASEAMAQQPQRRVPRRWLRWWFRAVLGAIVAYLVVTVCLVSCMPGRSQRGPLAALTPDEQAPARELRRDVEVLAVAIGPRGLLNPSSLRAAAAHIETEFREAGYAVERQTYAVRGQTCVNLIVQRPGVGRVDEVLVVGAHYDTVPGSPGEPFSQRVGLLPGRRRGG